LTISKLSVIIDLSLIKNKGDIMKEDYQDMLLRMAVKSKVIEDLLVDYNPDNKKLIEEARKKEGETL
tara:strand:- start:6689 stop:6889 length:201 start_codon:yes stop_codon:yes gene_type:complete